MNRLAGAACAVLALLSIAACTPSAPRCDFQYLEPLLESEAGYQNITKEVAPQWDKFAASLPGLKQVYRAELAGPVLVMLGWDELAKDITGVSAAALEDNSERRAPLALRKDEKGWFRFDRERPFTSYITVEYAERGLTVREWTPEVFATNHCVVAVRFRVEGGEDSAAWPKIFQTADRLRAAILAREGPTT